MMTLQRVPACAEHACHAWPPRQHITSHRNVFHRTPFALHRTAPHRDVVHRTDSSSLGAHSSSLCTAWQRNALDRIASHRIVSYRSRKHHLCITSYHIEPHASLCLTSYRIVSLWDRIIIASLHIASYSHPTASLCLTSYRPAPRFGTASHCIASHHIASHCTTAC